MDDGETSSVKIGAKTMEVSAEEGVSITGDVSVTGNITATEDVKAGDISLTNHTHVAGTLAAPNGPVTGATGAPTATGV